MDMLIIILLPKQCEIFVDKTKRIVSVHLQNNFDIERWRLLFLLLPGWGCGGCAGGGGGGAGSGGGGGGRRRRGGGSGSGSGSGAECMIQKLASEIKKVTKNNVRTKAFR